MQEPPPPEDDGLHIPTVGDWSRDKHHFLRRYIDAFTTSMKEKGWSGLHYIDLFAGAGIERLDQLDVLDWGSPLIAAQARHPFSRLHLCEKDPNKHRALKERITRMKLPSAPQVLCGDANQQVAQIVAEIPMRSLSLAFLDPYGLHLDFTTLRALSSRRIDLIILFPDLVDALRNWKRYEAQPDSNMDRFFGEGADWREVFRKFPHKQRAERLRALYEAQIRKLGYTYFEPERIMAKSHPLYQLIFCTRDEFAVGLWSRAVEKKANDQRTFLFDDPK